MKRYTSDPEKAILYARQNGLCKCGAALFKGKYHIDHAVALVRGGTDTLDNKQLLCIPCHKAKTFHPRSKATTLGSDIGEAAKTKRLIRKRERPKSKRKMQSRGFRKDLSKHFDGSITPRK
jgi:5-methylcytosine-specific restriction endonuclease McrA